MAQNTTTTDAVIEQLTTMPEMDIDAARGVRDETDLPRRTFRTPPDENADFVTVLLCGEGIIAVTDRFVEEDFAVSGPLDDQTAFDDLVDDGVLVEMG